MSEPAKCRDCRRPDGGVRHINCETCGGSGLDVPPVDPEVLDRACDAAWKACWPEFPHRPGSTGDRHIRRALESAAPIIAAATLSEYRDDPKVGEIRGFIVNVDCPIHGAPAVASVSDVKTNVEEDASHE